MIGVAWARRYVSPRQRTLTRREQRTREIAYALKDPGVRGSRARKIASEAMAKIRPVPRPQLVPIPSSDGSNAANLALAEVIAARIPGAEVLDVLSRGQPLEPSHLRRRRGEAGATMDKHEFWLGRAHLLDRDRVVFVDNVVTTGATMAAAKRAVGGGQGLVWAKAEAP